MHKVLFVVDHVYTTVCPLEDTLWEDLVSVIDDITSYYVDGFQFYTQYPVHWDGKVHLFVQSKALLPTGLLMKVAFELKAQGYTCEIQDLRTYLEPLGKVEFLPGMEEREYQREAVEAGLKYKCGIFSLPPGSGKTDLLAMLIKAIGRKTLWLTHLTTLAYQTTERFERRFGHPVGMVGDGVWDVGDITIAMVQTLYRRWKDKAVRKLVEEAEVLILDECHHSRSSSWIRIISHCKAPYRFGASATPLDTGISSMRLVGMTGDVIYHLTATQGVEEGVLVAPEVYMVSYNAPQLPPELFGGDWGPLYREGIVENEARNNLAAEIAMWGAMSRKPTVVLIQRIDHGRDISNRLASLLGTNAYHTFMWGMHGSAHRAEKITDFRKGKLRVLITSSILDEGIDIPEIELMILCSAGKSAVKDIQRLGRGMRPNLMKKFYLVDFIDDSNLVLRRHSKKRAKDYARIGVGTIATVTADKLKEILLGGKGL